MTKVPGSEGGESIQSVVQSPEVAKQEILVTPEDSGFAEFCAEMDKKVESDPDLKRLIEKLKGLIEFFRSKVALFPEGSDTRKKLEGVADSVSPDFLLKGSQSTPELVVKIYSEINQYGNFGFSEFNEYLERVRMPLLEINFKTGRPIFVSPWKQNADGQEDNPSFKEVERVEQILKDIFKKTKGQGQLFAEVLKTELPNLYFVFQEQIKYRRSALLAKSEGELRYKLLGDTSHILRNSFLSIKASLQVSEQNLSPELDEVVKRYSQIYEEERVK